MPGKIRVNIIVKGSVQGVFFRSQTKERADKLGVFGYVRNLPGGGLEAVFEGEKEKVEDLVEWTRQGPSLAEVQSVDVEREEYKGEFTNFEIRY